MRREGLFRRGSECSSRCVEASQKVAQSNSIHVHFAQKWEGAQVVEPPGFSAGDNRHRNRESTRGVDDREPAERLAVIRQLGEHDRPDEIRHRGAFDLLPSAHVMNRTYAEIGENPAQGSLPSDVIVDDEHVGVDPRFPLDWHHFQPNMYLAYLAYV
jgi:hypothetical protein